MAVGCYAFFILDETRQEQVLHSTLDLKRERVCVGASNNMSTNG